MALTLWLTDRSRYEAGLHHCPRERYLRYHAGPHGYGWDRQAQSMPAVTGNLVHEPLSVILGYCRDHDTLPPDEVVYHQAIAPAVAKYHQLVERRGLAATTDAQELAQIVMEQTTLLESLVWIYTRYVLPDYLAEYRVVLVEAEESVVIGCTCGLGDRIDTAEAHDARGCLGIGWMTRGDCVGQHRVESSRYRYDEFKTTGDAGQNWQAAWYHRVQMIAGVLGAERRLSAETGQTVTIDEVWIPALIKGRHQREWNPEEGKASGPKYQATSLVYGGRRAANLPLYDEQWSAEWANQYYTDTDGKRRKRGKEFVRTGIWELPAALWAQEGGLSPSDYWTRWLQPTGKLAGAFTYVGPIYRQAWKLAAFEQQLIGEEGRWQDALWAVYAAIQTHGSWSHPEVQRVLDRVAPQARGEACESFFGDKCAYLPICERYEGWEAPGDGLGYVPRLPHHQPEVDQAVARGCLLPPEGLADEGEE